MDRSRSRIITRGLKVLGALGLALSLSGCIVAPYGPRFGYYHPFHPHYYGYY